MTPDQTKGNIMSMAVLACAHGIRLILASIPPAACFPWRPELDTSAKIAAMNVWLKGHEAATGAIYADYRTTLHEGYAMRAKWTSDGVHPNPACYAVMAPIAENAIHGVLATPAPSATATAR